MNGIRTARSSAASKGDRSALSHGRTFYWRLYKGRKKIRWALFRRIFRDAGNDIGRTVFVAGNARSGTTWLANILSAQLRGRILFEPFHPGMVEAYRRFDYFRYVGPGEEDQALSDYCAELFQGHIRSPWIDRQIERLHPQYRIVKSVRANLFLEWLRQVFPALPLLFIVRHPCAVVLSRMKLGWDPELDLGYLLRTEPLCNHYLHDKLGIVRSARTVEEKNAVIWCIMNLVPLQQFGPDLAPLVFYEDLCTRPEAAVPALFELIGQPYDEKAFAELGRPATTSQKDSAVVIGEDRVHAWRRELNESQVASILGIVERFELDYLYGDSVTPQIPGNSGAAQMRRAVHD